MIVRVVFNVEGNALNTPTTETHWIYILCSHTLIALSSGLSCNIKYDTLGYKVAKESATVICVGLHINLFATILAEHSNVAVN